MTTSIPGIPGSCALAALVLAFGAARASAEVVCSSFKGTVTDVRPGVGQFGVPEVDPGTEITGTLAYDASVPGLEGSGGTEYVPGVLSVTLTIANVQSVPDLTADLPHGRIVVSDAPAGGGSDGFFFNGHTSFDERVGPIIVLLMLEDPSGALLDSEALPRALDLSRFPAASLEARSQPGDGRSFLFAASIEAIAPCPAVERPFRRADANADGSIDLADAVATLSFLFLSGAEPSCLKTADANDDGVVDIADPVYTLLGLFAGGEPIPEPRDRCGQDPTADDLSCAAYAGCG